MQIFMKGQPWDTHNSNTAGTRSCCEQTDLPVAGLLTDLQQRGLVLEEVELLARDLRARLEVREVERLARTQHGAVSRVQAEQLGVSLKTQRGQMKAGLWSMRLGALLVPARPRSLDAAEAVFAALLRHHPNDPRLNEMAKNISAARTAWRTSCTRS